MICCNWLNHFIQQQKGDYNVADDKVVDKNVEMLETTEVADICGTVESCNSIAEAVDPLEFVAPIDDPESSVAEINANDGTPVIDEGIGKRCVTSDKDGVLIIGGTDTEGKGFVLKKYADETCPLLTINDMVAVDAVFVDYSLATDEYPYILFVAGRRSDGNVIIVKCSNELDIIDSIVFSDQEGPVTTMTNWNGTILIAVILGTEDGINIPAFIEMSPDMECLRRVMVTPETPENFKTEGTFATGVIVGFVPLADRIVMAGYMSNNDGAGFGFVSTIDNDLNTIRSLTVVDPTIASTTIRAISMNDDGTFTIILICNDPSFEQPYHLVNKLDTNLAVITDDNAVDSATDTVQ